MSRKEKTLTIVLMVVLGTCMHFVYKNIPSGVIANFLGNIFPVNETSWEHMKMIWYPFLTAGIIFSFKKKNHGYFGAFVLSSIIAILMQLGAFCTYQSFTGTSVLILDILIYVGSMVFCILMAFDYANKTWAKKLLPLWILLAVLITAEIVYLTYNPGKGYVFFDNEDFLLFRL